MIVGRGRPVYEGVAIGRIYVHMKNQVLTDRKCSDIEKEMERFRTAKEKAAEELSALYEKTAAEIGEEQAAIIEVQSLFLDDLDYIEGIEAMIKSGSEAAFSVHEIGDAQASAFAALDDDYMKARATDIRDISDRLVRILTGADQVFRMDEPGIIVAEDLTPSETVSLDKGKILAFVTRQGSSNSHTAILARVMNIPSLVLTDIDIDQSLNGRTMIVDGFTGNYYIDPDEKTLTEMTAKKKSAGEYKAGLEKYRGIESVSRTGRKVKLFANIGSPSDLKYVIDALIEDAKAYGHPMRILGITCDRRSQVEALYPGKFRFEETRASFDYLYDINRLADLGGKKLQAKRNHCNRFEQDYNWHYEELAPHKICAYIYELANAFNRFYHETKILAEEDKEVRKSYIALLVLTKKILESCIDVLGFEAPERM